MAVYDLSCRIYDGMPVFEGDREVRLRKYREIGADGFNSFEFSAGLHSGTHIDLPLHMLDICLTADVYPPECFFGPGVFIDAAGERVVEMKPEYEKLLKKDVCVLVRTGLTDIETDGAKAYTNHAVFGESFAEALVRAEVKLVGVDSPTVDKSPYTVHKRLLSSGIFIVEGLTGLEQLARAESFVFYALPLRIEAEASPVRAFAEERPVV